MNEHKLRNIIKVELTKAMGTTPTDAQKESGNYKKAHIKIKGLGISIENQKGSIRSGKDGNGVRWATIMKSHYGYIKRTMGADGDHVDVFIGDQLNSDRVYVIDQINQETGEFDEHKVMMCYRNKGEALASYRANYDYGWKVGKVTAMSMDEFKEWLNGDTTMPCHDEL